jgi:hypothetical protein
MQYMKNIQKPQRVIEDYQFEPMTIQPNTYDDLAQQQEQRRGSAMTQMNSQVPNSPGMQHDKRA